MKIRTKISDLQIGVTLGQNLYSPYGQLLLSKGTVVQWRHLKSLYQQGFKEVLLDIPDNPASTLDSPPPAALDANSISPNLDINLAVNQSLSYTKQIFTSIRHQKAFELQLAHKTINILLPSVIKNQTKNVFKYLKLVKQGQAYLLEHAVGVSILSTIIGQILGYNPESLQRLAISGLLHDSGMSLIRPEILNKTGSLTSEELAEVSRHPRLGYQLLTNYFPPNDPVMLGVLQHHEKIDGTGYPHRLTGDKISEFARIIAVADRFDAITSSRIYRRKESPYRAAEQLRTCSFNEIDPTICQRFLEFITSFYIGNIIRLNTGEIGEVIRIDPSEPSRPLIRVGDSYLDLRKSRHQYIDEIIS